MALTQTEINEVMQQLQPLIAKALNESASIAQAQANIQQGVTQYIGARYVPLFADPIEWDNTRAYEPLTIVLYQGNSFTTRQHTPAGIDINNDAFWAETGNYNAQVEQYRQEVVALDARITSVQTAADNALTAAGNAQTAAGNAQAAVNDEIVRANAAETAINNSKNNNTAYMTVYVSETGDDSNPGTETDPFKTVDGAMALIPRGSTCLEIVLDKGAYTTNVAFISNISLHFKAKTSAQLSFTNKVAVYNSYINLTGGTELTCVFSNGLHVDNSAMSLLNATINVSSRYDYSYASISCEGNSKVVSNVSCNMTNTVFTTSESGTYTHELTANATRFIYAINCRIAMHGTTKFVAPTNYANPYIRTERGFFTLQGTVDFNVTSMSSLLILRAVVAFIADNIFTTITQGKINTNYSYIKHTSASVIE